MMTWGVTHNFGKLTAKLQSVPPLGTAAALQQADEAFVAAMRKRSIPERSGRLKASLTQRAHRDHVARMQAKRMVLGTKVPYARYQKTRWRPLSRDERRAIMIAPLQETLRQWLGGTRAPTQGVIL